MMKKSKSQELDGQYGRNKENKNFKHDFAPKFKIFDVMLHYFISCNK